MKILRLGIVAAAMIGAAFGAAPQVKTVPRSRPPVLRPGAARPASVRPARAIFPLPGGVEVARRADEGSDTGWRSIGPDGGDVARFGRALDDPATVFAVTGPNPSFSDAPRPAVIWRSTDSGSSWTRVASVDADPKSFALAASNRMAMALSSGDRVFRTSDGGASWSSNAVPAGFRVDVLAFHPADSRTLIGIGVDLIAAESLTGFRSTDGGRTWTSSTLPFPASGVSSSRANGVVVSRSDPSTVYAWDYGSSALFRSRDGGLTWTETARPGPSYIQSVLVSANDPLRIYVAANFVYASGDGGASWVRCGPPTDDATAVEADHLTIDPLDPANLYGQDYRGLWRSADSGATWTFLPSPFDMYCRDLSAWGNQVLVGLHAGVIRSDTGGATWTESSRGLRAARIEAAATPLQASSYRYAAIWYSGFYRSGDAGASWTRKAMPGEFDGSVYTEIVCAPNDPARAFAISGGILETDDGGASWRRLPTPPDTYVRSLTVNPRWPDRFFASGYRSTGGHTSDVEMTFSRSGDGGRTWFHRVFSGSYGVFGTSVACDEAETVLYEGGRADFWPRADAAGLLFRSRDRGLTWSPVATGIFARSGYGVNDVAVDRTRPARLWVATAGQGIFRSDDGGDSWRQALPGIGVTAIAADRSNPALLFAATERGVYRSGDGGLSWTPLSRGWPAGLAATTLSWSPEPRTLTAGSDGGGLWMSANADQVLLSVAASEGGTTDPAPGEHFYEQKAVVILKATPRAGFEFAGWTGSVTGSQNPVSITMTGDKAVAASFRDIRPILSIRVTSGGTTDPAPGDYRFLSNTPVVVRATPLPGYAFTGWSGDVTGPANPLTVTMDRSHSVTAGFARVLYPPNAFAAVRGSSRSLLQIRYFHRLTWAANPASVGASGYRVYDVTGGGKSILAEVPATATEYVRWGVGKDATAVYEITAFDAQGCESAPARAQVK